MKNKKGFTLIEITAVVLILGVIFLITYPTLEHILKKNEEEQTNIDKESMEIAVKTYVNLHSSNYNLIDDDTIKIKIEDLKSEGIIDLDTYDYIYVSCKYNSGNYDCNLEKE